MEMLIFAPCILLIVVLTWFFLNPKKKARFPPGPKTVPIFGNALQFDFKKFISQLGDLGNNYDDAYTVRLFSDDIVVLNSYDIIQEVISGKHAHVVSGRPATFVREHYLRNDEIFHTYSDKWVVLRQIVSQGLKTYGSNLREVEDLVRTELEDLVSRIRNESGQGVDPHYYIDGYFTKIMLLLLIGADVNADDKIITLCSQVTTDLDYLCNPEVASLMTKLPFLGYLPFGYGKTFKRFKRNHALLKRTLKETRKSGVHKTQCFMDYMLEQQKAGTITSDNVSDVFLDILVAGLATSRSTLYSLLLILTSRVDIQERIQVEIDAHIGRSRLPCAEDKHRMPYTQAVIWEVFRYATAAPMTLPRSTLEDVQIRDYFIPKDTTIFYNIWHVLHEESFWKNPWTFDPTRFLDKHGNLVPPEDEKRRRMIAFGLGKRLCIGEVLARLRIFMACVAILQKYTLLPDPECPLPDVDPRTFDVCVLLSPPRYNIIFKARPT